MVKRGRLKFYSFGFVGSNPTLSNFFSNFLILVFIFLFCFLEMSSSTFLSFLLRRSPTFFFNRTARCLSCHHSSPLLFSSPQFSFLSSSLPSPSSFPLSSFTPSFQKSLFSQNLLPTPCPSQNLSKQIFLSTNPQKDIFQTHPFHFIAKLIGVPIPSLSGSLSSPSSLATTHHHRISKK